MWDSGFASFVEERCSKCGRKRIFNSLKRGHEIKNKIDCIRNKVCYTNTYNDRSKARSSAKWSRSNTPGLGTNPKPDDEQTFYKFEDVPNVNAFQPVVHISHLSAKVIHSKLVCGEQVDSSGSQRTQVYYCLFTLPPKIIS